MQERAEKIERELRRLHLEPAPGEAVVEASGRTDLGARARGRAQQQELEIVDLHAADLELDLPFRQSQRLRAEVEEPDLDSRHDDGVDATAAQVAERPVHHDPRQVGQLELAEGRHAPHLRGGVAPRVLLRLGRQGELKLARLRCRHGSPYGGPGAPGYMAPVVRRLTDPDH